MNQINVEKISNSLFESGKMVNQALNWLLLMGLTLVVIAWTSEPDSKIDIPGISLSLDRIRATAVFLMFYCLALFRFFISLTHQQMLFSQFVDTFCLGDNATVTQPWNHVYPSVVNHLLYHRYFKEGEIIRFNVLFLLTIGILLLLLPVVAIIFHGKIFFEQFMETGEVDYVQLILVALSAFCMKGVLDNFRLQPNEVTSAKAKDSKNEL